MKAAGLVVSVAYWLTFAYFCSYLLVTLVPPVQLQPNCFLSQRKVFGTCFPCLLRKIEFRERRPKPQKSQMIYDADEEKSQRSHSDRFIDVLALMMLRPPLFPLRLLNYSFIDFYRATPSPSTERESQEDLGITSSTILQN